jgi:hypothetical protein
MDQLTPEQEEYGVDEFREILKRPRSEREAVRYELLSRAMQYKKTKADCNIYRCRENSATLDKAIDTLVAVARAILPEEML